ncbi:hypothetical protein O3Q51_01655 [Cryomorphaceae bacterium 1068]|nr:hypothetical protein [Cryomorphaceae bacterium 1068]
MAKEFVDRILNKLFGDKSDSSREEMPPVKEKLKRSDKFLYDFQEWKDSSRSAAVFTRLSSLHEDVLNGQETDLLHIHKTPQANGFFFDDRTGIEVEEFSFILDHFKDRALEEGYSIYSSEKRYQEKSDSVQEMERHYLKPSLDPSLELPIDQRYGNILLEYVAYNKKPAYLKVMVSCYSDRNYTNALDFRQLAVKLFS